jgi:periplasmic copper chaperone A
MNHDRRFIACWPMLLLSVWTSVVTAQAAPIEIRDAWVRWLPGNIPSGGYLTAVNHGDVTVQLVGASSPDYGEISIHRSSEHNGRMQMAVIDSIAVPGHSTLVFAAQGYHLMLLQPKKALKPGDRVTIVLRFLSGASLETRFELRPPDTDGASH